MTKIEVDQSGKIEQKQYDTRIGAAKNKMYSIVIIDKRLKRGLLSRHKQLKRKFRVLSLFTASTFLAIRPLLSEGDTILLDDEYPNQMKLVIRLLNTLIKIHNLPKPDQIIVASHNEVKRAHLVSRKPNLANYKLMININKSTTLAELYEQTLKLLRK